MRDKSERFIYERLRYKMGSDSKEFIWLQVLFIDIEKGDVVRLVEKSTGLPADGYAMQYVLRGPHRVRCEMREYPMPRSGKWQPLDEELKGKTVPKPHFLPCGVDDPEAEGEVQIETRNYRPVRGPTVGALKWPAQSQPQPEHPA